MKINPGSQDNLGSLRMHVTADDEKKNPAFESEKGTQHNIHEMIHHDADVMDNGKRKLLQEERSKFVERFAGRSPKSSCSFSRRPKSAAMASMKSSYKRKLKKKEESSLDEEMVREHNRLLLFPENLRDREEFECIFKMPIAKVAEMRNEAQSYLNLELGVDSEKDERYFQTPETIVKKYSFMQRDYTELKQKQEQKRQQKRNLERERTRKKLERQQSNMSKSMSHESFRSKPSASAYMSGKGIGMVPSGAGTQIFGTQARFHKQKTSPKMHGNSQASQKSKSLTKTLMKGEQLLVDVFLLRMEHLGLQDKSTLEARDNLMKCYLAQRKNRDAHDIQDNTTEHYQKLKQRTRIKKERALTRASMSSPKPIIGMDRLSIAPPMKTISDECEQKSCKTLSPIQKRKEQTQTGLFERKINGWVGKSEEGTTGSSSFQTEYPKWTEFRANVKLQLLSNADTVFREPIAVSFSYTHKDDAERLHNELDEIAIVSEDGLITSETGLGMIEIKTLGNVVSRKRLPKDQNSGTILFTGKDIPHHGNFRAYYLIHGSQFAHGKPVTMVIRPVTMSLSWECEDNQVFCGDKLVLNYRMNLKSSTNKVSTDWIGIYALNSYQKDEESLQLERCIARKTLSGAGVSGQVVFEGEADGIGKQMGPGKYVARAFCGATNTQTGQSKTLQVRAKLDEKRISRALVDRHIKICLISPTNQMGEERQVVKEFLTGFLKEFTSDRGIDFTIVDLMDSFNGNDLLENAKYSTVETLFYEIESSRPYLIYLFGNKFGCIPFIDERLVSLMPWMSTGKQIRSGHGQVSLFELAIDFGWMIPVAQGDSHLAHGVLFCKQDPTVDEETDDAIANGKCSEEQLRQGVRVTGICEASPEDNFDGLLRIEENIMASGAAFVDNFCSPADVARTCLSQVAAICEEMYPTRGSRPDPSFEELRPLHFESMSRIYMDRHVDTKTEKHVCELLENYLGQPLTSLPWSWKHMIQYQRARLERLGIEVKHLGFEKTSKKQQQPAPPAPPAPQQQQQPSRKRNAKKKELEVEETNEVSLETILKDSLFLSVLDFEWHNDHTYLPNGFTRAQPVAVVAPPRFGKTSLIVRLMEVLISRTIPWRYRKSIYQNMTPFAHGIQLNGKQTFLLGVLLGGYSPLKRAENVLDHIQKTCALSFGSTFRESYGKLNQELPVFQRIIDALKILGKQLVLVIDGIQNLEVKSENPLWWLPVDIDPSVVKVICTMTPDSRSYKETQRRLWNFVLLGGCSVPFPDIRSHADTNGTNNSHHHQQQQVEDHKIMLECLEQSNIIVTQDFRNWKEIDGVSSSDLKEQVEAISKQYTRKFGNVIDPVLEQFHQGGDSMWWCFKVDFSTQELTKLASRARRKNIQGSPPSFRYHDTSMGRYALILDGFNFNLLQQRDYTIIGRTSTMELLKMMLQRLIKKYKLAAAMLQALYRSPNNLSETEMQTLLKAQTPKYRFNELEYCICRRIIVTLCGNEYSGRFILRGTQERSLVGKLVTEMNLPRIQLGGESASFQPTPVTRRQQTIGSIHH